MAALQKPKPKSNYNSNFYSEIHILNMNTVITWIPGKSGIRCFKCWSQVLETGGQFLIRFLVSEVHRDRSIQLRRSPMPNFFATNSCEKLDDTANRRKFRLRNQPLLRVPLADYVIINGIYLNRFNSKLLVWCYYLSSFLWGRLNCQKWWECC